VTLKNAQRTAVLPQRTGVLPQRMAIGRPDRSDGGLDRSDGGHVGRADRSDKSDGGLGRSDGGPDRTVQRTSDHSFQRYFEYLQILLCKQAKNSK
jgi:hypothetical protein